MLKRLSFRLHAALETHLPEQRLFLKSDTSTRFIRLRPATQAVGLAGGVLLIGWTILSTSILLMDSMSAGDGRAQAERQQALFEQRLTALSADRDARAAEAARAQERFNLALAEVSAMQARLLASEEARKELETGVEVIQDTLRATIRDRDAARAEAAALAATVKAETGSTRSAEEAAADAAATIEIMAEALTGTAAERDAMAGAAVAAQERINAVQAEKRALMARMDVIFARLEEAVSVSMEPLDEMFRAAGLEPEELISEVKRGYSGQGGPLTPITVSAANAALTPEEVRANAILAGLDTVNLYRIAAEKAPFAVPLKSAFRFTSGFGYRRDPKGAGTRMHNGADFAASPGTPIHATADGEVTFAGWDSGYGRQVRIRHGFGIVTTYSHLSAIRVEVGQRVSRGDRIGDMGSSGRSTGTHLHYEVHLDGKPVNPMTFIRAASNVF